jgi:hypothetical protein
MEPPSKKVKVVDSSKGILRSKPIGQREISDEAS